MSLSSRLLLSAGAAAALAFLAVAQTTAGDKPKLTPREAFYSVGVESSTQKTGGKEQSKTKTSKDPTGGGPKILKVSDGPAIGVEYVLRKNIDGRMADISPDAVFHRKDGIAFVVRTNAPGYLYIGNKLSNGTWKTMFPSPETEGGDNHVEAMRWYDMPPGYQFVFDDPPGVEEVFVLFSRERVQDLESLWQSPKAAPKPGAKASDSPARLMAGIPDSIVNQLRSNSTRDLRIEKIDQDTAAPGKTKEKAVYIINPTGRSDSRVWADLKLVHK